jgi:dephospho-CoA kinase
VLLEKGDKVIMADKIVIGLTGNIATGKSLVLRMLQELGATPIDADKLVHQLMRQGGSVYQAIVEEFGKFVLDEKGEISRPRLGNIVFNDPDGLAKLEALTHPGVRQEIQQLIDNASTQVVAVEAIKLFESGLAGQCDSTWVVVAPPNTQLERLTGRRKLTPDQAKQRIKAQSSQQEKAAKANVVIDNSGALAKTWTIVKKHYTDLLRAKSGAAQPEVEAPVVTPTPVPLDEINLDEVIIRRAKREDLNRMAELIATGTKGALHPDLSAMMENLFSRAYIVALAKDYVVGMMGWQAENLVAGLQDFYVVRDDLWATVGQKMLDKVHEEINNLSCEVSLIFITTPTGPKPIEFLESQGYEQFESKNLIPDWREAAVEWQPENSVLLYKKMREQRIMVPM